MPAIPYFINNYKPGWNPKAAIKSSLSRFNRTDSPSSSLGPQQPNSPALSTILDIKDDQSSLDFDGGRPDEYGNDLVDRTSESRPSNASSAAALEKLEISLPPELRIDWFAEKFAGNSVKADVDAGVNTLDQDTKDTLAGKVKDDQGLFETLEDALARHVDSNPSRLVAMSGLDFQLPGMSPANKHPPDPLTIPNDPTDSALRKLPRDSLTMLTSRLSITDTPTSSALSGTTLARALISNTFAMPIDRLSEGGMVRSDSTVLPPDSLHRYMFSIAPDAPPMPPDAETLYVAPKKPRSERRKQLKRRSSTGTLNTRALPDLPTSRRTSLNLSPGFEFDGFLKSPSSWSPDTPSPIRSIPAIPESTTPDTPPTETTNSVALPLLPEGVRRLPDPRSQTSSSAGVSPSISSKGSSTPSKEVDSKGLDDVLEYYNHGDSSAPLLAGASFRPEISPIKEETSSQLSPNSPFQNDARDSKRVLPVGARSPRSRSDPVQVARQPSDARSVSKLLFLPSQNDSSPASLKSSRSFEPHASDNASSYGQDIRNPSRQRTSSTPLPTSLSGAETFGSGEHVQRSGDDSRWNGAEDTVSSINIDVNHSSSRVSDPPVIGLNTLPAIPGSPLEFINPASPPHVETHARESSPSQPGYSASTSFNSSAPSPPVVRTISLPTDIPTLPPAVISNIVTTSSDMAAVNGGGSITTVQENGLSHPAISDLSIPHHLHAYKDDFLTRTSTFSMGSPPPYYEVVNQGHVHAGLATPSTAYVGPSASDPAAGSLRMSGEWNVNDSRRGSPARSRVRPRPPLPIGPRRPSHGSGSVAAVSQSDLSRQRSGRITAIPSPKFHTPPPKWRGHTMDAARWTFKSSQLQNIVSKAIKQSSEASLIRLLEPEILENDVPSEIAILETLRTDLKTKYKLLTRRRAGLFEALSSFLTGSTEEGQGYGHRLLEELSEVSATLDHLSEELHSADTQLASLDLLTQVHMSSALAVALRKLNTSFLKQMAENENLRNDLFSVEAERDEAWSQAERIAMELDQLVTMSEDSSPVVSHRSSRISAHRKSLARASKAGLRLKVPQRRFSKRLSSTPSGGAFGSAFVSSASSSSLNGGLHLRSKTISPLKSARQFLSPPILNTSVNSPSSSTRALIQAQDELYAMLGLSTAPDSSLRRSRSGKSSNATPTSPTRRHSIFLPNDTFHPPSLSSSSAAAAAGAGRRRRRSSLPPYSTLAQVSNAMAADRNAMLVTFDMLSAAVDDDHHKLLF